MFPEPDEIQFTQAASMHVRGAREDAKARGGKRVSGLFGLVAHQKLEGPAESRLARHLDHVQHVAPGSPRLEV